MQYAVYRPSTGMWDARYTTEFLGTAGDLPVPLDYSGDGHPEFAVYRPSTGEWLVRNQPTVQFGDAMDVPVPSRPSLMMIAPNGDYDGDRVADLGVYRASTGQWFVRNRPTVQFGDESDKPVPADYNGDGTMDVAVFRPSTGMWSVRDQFTVQFGDAGDIPVPGDYDGDRLAEVAVYRPSTGVWLHPQPQERAVRRAGRRAGAGRLQRRWFDGDRRLSSRDRTLVRPAISWRCHSAGRRPSRCPATTTVTA